MADLLAKLTRQGVRDLNGIGPRRDTRNHGPLPCLHDWQLDWCGCPPWDNCGHGMIRRCRKCREVSRG